MGLFLIADTCPESVNAYVRGSLTHIIIEIHPQLVLPENLLPKHEPNCLLPYPQTSWNVRSDYAEDDR